MKKNVGSIDQKVRVVLGLGLLSLLYFLPSPQNLLGLIGLVPLGTGLINFCPVYSIFGISTCSSEHNQNKTA